MNDFRRYHALYHSALAHKAWYDKSRNGGDNWQAVETANVVIGMEQATIRDIDNRLKTATGAEAILLRKERENSQRKIDEATAKIKQLGGTVDPKDPARKYGGKGTYNNKSTVGTIADRWRNRK